LIVRSACCGCFGRGSAVRSAVGVLAEKDFEIFITVDRNLSFQQHLPHYTIAVIVLRARTNRLQDLRPLVPKLLEMLPKAKEGEALWVNI
jgi:hypothetical protein